MNIIQKLEEPFGLGDLAYWAFRPFVYAIDWVWGTDMRHCDLCKERRVKWNGFGTVPNYIPVSVLFFFGILIAL